MTPAASFPPDILSLLALGGIKPSNVILAIFAGIVALAAVSFALRGRSRKPPGAYLLAFLNPLVVFAIASGPVHAFALAAMVVLWRAVIALLSEQDHRAVIALGLALGISPFLSSSILVLYPPLAIAAPLLTPWGRDLRRLGGFLTAIMAPCLMAGASLLYLYWIFEVPLRLPTFRHDAAPTLVLALSGGALIALAGRRATIGAFAGALVVGAAILLLLLRLGAALPINIGWTAP
ncbi:MAG: hypothetical protein AB7P23_00595 [Amphiplicatus sp.]